MFGWLWRLLGMETSKPANARILCMHQADTWCWPANLGEKTAGVCHHCGEPIWYEKQNEWVPLKFCNRCVEAFHHGT